MTMEVTEYASILVSYYRIETAHVELYTIQRLFKYMYTLESEVAVISRPQKHQPRCTTCTNGRESCAHHSRFKLH